MSKPVHRTVARLTRRNFLKGAGAAALSVSPLASILLGASSLSARDYYPIPSTITVSTWPVLIWGVPYMVGLKKGFYDQEGVKIEEIIGSKGGGTTVRNLMAGQLPFGEMATPAAVNAWLAGAPLTVIAAASRTSGPMGFAVRGDSSIQSITELKGKRIGFTSPGGGSHAFAVLSVAHAEGISLNDVELKATGGLSNAMTLLKSEDVDAAVFILPFQLPQIRSGEIRPLWWEDTFTESAPQFGVIVAGPSVQQNQPEAVRAFLRAHIRAQNYANKHVREAAEIWHEFFSDISVEDFEETLRKANLEKDMSKQFDPVSLDLIEESLQLMGTIDPDQQIPWNEIINQDYLPADMRVDLM